MSGGYFEYRQSAIRDIAEMVEGLIENNDSKEVDRYGERIGRGYPPDVISSFREAAKALRVAYVYAHRIDWLVSDDDGVEEFRTRLTDELSKLDK